MKLPLLVGLISAALSVGVATPATVTAVKHHNELLLKAEAEEEEAETSLEEESEEEKGLCYGVVANVEFILVCTYREGGADPKLIAFRKR